MIFKIIVNLGTFLIITLLSTSALIYLGTGLIFCFLIGLLEFALWEIFFFKNGNEI